VHRWFEEPLRKYGVALSKRVGAKRSSRVVVPAPRTAPDALAPRILLPEVPVPGASSRDRIGV
jgi:hypothetical protein